MEKQPVFGAVQRGTEDSAIQGSRLPDSDPKCDGSNRRGKGHPSQLTPISWLPISGGATRKSASYTAMRQ